MNSMEQQFLELVNVVSNMQQRIMVLENANHVLLQSQKQLTQLTENNQLELQWTMRNLYYEVNDPRLGNNKTFYPNIEEIDNTINEIVDNHKSLSRFGDGEFATISGKLRHKFQTVIDKKFSQRLSDVLTCSEKDLLIGIADNYGNLDKYSEQTKREIRCYLSPQVRYEHLQLLDKDKKYHNAYITRPYVIYADNNTDAPAKRFSNLKRIWDSRECVFVEGCFTGLGVGNDLFDNAASVRRILCPPENAFLKYDEILEVCMSQSKDVLFLLALGPTASVLAYDLCKAGYQAVDIGHIDLEYEWFKEGKGVRTFIPGKYSNEWHEDVELLPIEDISFKQEVIAEIYI